MILEIPKVCLDISEGEPPGKLTAYVLQYEQLPIGDPEVGEGGEGDPIFLLPDLHLLSCDRHYGKYFHLNAGREEQLIALLRRLVELRDQDPEYGHMRVIQLGDFHDLWRERLHWWGEGVESMLDRQIRKHRDLFDVLRTLRCERVVGNHDDKLADAKVRKKLERHPISGYFPPGFVHTRGLSTRRGAFTRIDMLHGHEFERGESAWRRRWVNSIFCRLADPDFGIGTKDEWQHELLPEGTPDTELLPQGTVYLPGSKLSKEQKAEQKLYAVLADLRHDTCAHDASDELRHRTRCGVVIGHTHHPRIVRGGQPGDFVLIDCGSWVNESTAVGHRKEDKLKFWNGQLGILSGPWAAVVQIGAP